MMKDENSKNQRFMIYDFGSNLLWNILYCIVVKEAVLGPQDDAVKDSQTKHTVDGQSVNESADQQKSTVH